MEQICSSFSPFFERILYLRGLYNLSTFIRSSKVSLLATGGGLYFYLAYYSLRYFWAFYFIIERVSLFRTLKLLLRQAPFTLVWYLLTTELTCSSYCFSLSIFYGLRSPPSYQLDQFICLNCCNSPTIFSIYSSSGLSIHPSLYFPNRSSNFYSKSLLQCYLTIPFIIFFYSASSYYSYCFNKFLDDLGTTPTLWTLTLSVSLLHLLSAFLIPCWIFSSWLRNRFFEASIA